MALSLHPGVSVARDAREHGVSANQVFSWRRLYEQGRLGVPTLMREDGMLPVVLAPSVPASNNADADGDADGRRNASPRIAKFLLASATCVVDSIAF